MPRARGDLASIYAHLKAAAGIATAERYLANLRNHLERTARLGDEISPGLRLVVHGNYHIYFRVTPTETIIVRVLHSARNVRRFSFHEDPAPPMLPPAAHQPQ